MDIGGEPDMNDLNNLSVVDKLVLYFERSVTVWLLLKDEAGLIAALAAAKTLNSDDRQIIVTLLDKIYDQWNKQDTDNLFVEILKSIQDLKEIITSTDWTTEDGVAERARLKMVDAEYEEALMDGDPDIFVRRYPDSFTPPSE